MIERCRQCAAEILRTDDETDHTRCSALYAQAWLRTYAPLELPNPHPAPLPVRRRAIEATQTVVAEIQLRVELMAGAARVREANEAAFPKGRKRRFLSAGDEADLDLVHGLGQFVLVPDRDPSEPEDESLRRHEAVHPNMPRIKAGTVVQGGADRDRPTIRRQRHRP